MAEWCNSFVIVPKPNGIVYLCLHPVKLNQALIRPVHAGPTINDILFKLTNVCYMTIIDASSGYHISKLDKNIIMLNHICKSIWQAQFHKTTLWSGANR